jgi:hypothetical protein
MAFFAFFHAVVGVAKMAGEKPGHNEEMRTSALNLPEFFCQKPGE